MGKKLLKTHKVDFSADSMDFKWYTVVTQFNWERKAAENIEKRFESLGCGSLFGEIVVPIVEFTEVSEKGRTVKKSRNVLESGYIFIKMVLNNDTWNVVRQTTGVAGWLNMDGRPFPVEEAKVLAIKKQVNGLTAEDVKTLEFKGVPGDKIRVKDHTMQGLEAEVTEVIKDKELVKANLLLNGFKLELKFSQVELLK